LRGRTGEAAAGALVLRSRGNETVEPLGRLVSEPSVLTVRWRGLASACGSAELRGRLELSCRGQSIRERGQLTALALASLPALGLPRKRETSEPCGVGSPRGAVEPTPRARGRRDAASRVAAAAGAMATAEDDRRAFAQADSRAARGRRDRVLAPRLCEARFSALKLARARSSALGPQAVTAGADALRARLDVGVCCLERPTRREGIDRRKVARTWPICVSLAVRRSVPAAAAL